MKPRGTRGSVLPDRVTASELEAGTGRSVQGKRGGLGAGHGEGEREDRKSPVTPGPLQLMVRSWNSDLI